MLPISQEEFNQAFLSGMLQGIWMVLKAGWPYIIGLIGLKVLFNFLGKRSRKKD